MHFSKVANAPQQWHSFRSCQAIDAKNEMIQKSVQSDVTWARTLGRKLNTEPKNLETGNRKISFGQPSNLFCAFLCISVHFRFECFHVCSQLLSVTDIMGHSDSFSTAWHQQSTSIWVIVLHRVWATMLHHSINTPRYSSPKTEAVRWLL